LNKKCKSFQLFLGGINRDTTEKPYTYSLDEFMKFSKLNDYDDLASKDTDTIQDLLERWIMLLKNKNLRSNTIRGKLNAVELFLDMNKKIWYRKVVRKLVGKEDEIPGGKIPFTTDEVFLMIKQAKKPRDVFMIHYLASTGTRPASLEDPVLRIKHLVDMSHDCKAIKVYDGSKEGYWAFLTPESARAFNDYLKWRKFNGEEITEESPVFANYVNEPKTKNKHLSSFSIREILDRIMKTAGVERIKTGNRYDKAIIYGFRKRFNGILKMNNEVNSNIAEKLMAHKRGLDGVYLQPTREECFREFLKAIPELTIDPIERKNQEIELKEKEISELQAKQNQVDELIQKQDKMQEQLNNLKELNPDLPYILRRDPKTGKLNLESVEVDMDMFRAGGNEELADKLRKKKK